ncbi:baculoviral IAP repeat-containing protein 5 [Chironomus tepperi]|uniref:baculoviral IAP repeat-containing protein 5 n=1 Tax=Chironomus tepperi TaxID=113505 RepID=UPI00391F7D84
MPALHEASAEELKRPSTIVTTLENTLKIFEEHRIKSFENWEFDENEKCSVSEMAKAGFYYTGLSKDDDSATCFVCGKVLDGWENTDDPWMEHQKHSANCKFVQMRRSEDDLTLEEFLDLFKHIIKQFLTNQFHKKEASFIKRIENIRDIIKNQQY